jgi:hypothetical protein
VSRLLTTGAVALTIGMLGGASALAQSTSSASTDATILSASQLLTKEGQAPAQTVMSDVLGMDSKGSTANAGPNTLAGAAALTSSDLKDASGGKNTTTNVLIGAVTDQSLAASNTGNTMTVGGDITNGSVSINPNAFSGFNGVGNFVMNTGNQNNVQGALNITIVLTPTH